MLPFKMCINKSNFQQFEIVGHGSETQFHVGNNYILQFTTLRANVNALK